MNIGNDDSYIKLDYRDATPERYQDDIALSVELVHVAGFNGRNESVWFGRAERASFLSDLHFLEQSRRGQSRLVAIGAQSEFDTFVLEISAQGPGSRLIVSADLIAPYYILEF